MSIRSKLIGDVGVVKVKGSLTGEKEIAEVREAVRETVDGGTKNIVIDLHRVNWMNSNGIGMLLACYAKVQSVEGRLVLSRVSEKIYRVMDITKTIRLYDLYDSVREAVRSFQ